LKVDHDAMPLHQVTVHLLGERNDMKDGRQNHTKQNTPYNEIHDYLS
jgi:hypothetical protein